MTKTADCVMQGTELTIRTGEVLNSENAPVFQQEITDFLKDHNPERVTMDCRKLTYISSAGLRIILALKKDYPETRIINASAEIYDILRMTGFTQLLEVQRAMRVISIAGCEEIGTGAKGKVVRIAPDTIVKVFYNSDSIDSIKREQELSRLTFVAGLPTAIPYDIVRIEEGGYGAVYELLDADTFSGVYMKGKKSLDELTKMSAELLWEIHSTETDSGIVPDMKETVLRWIDSLKGGIPEEMYGRLKELVQAVPEDRHLIHGDFHFNNIMLQNDEALLIDMEKLSCGNPVFEIGCMYSVYCCFNEFDHERSQRFFGFPYETACAAFVRILNYYLREWDEARINEIVDKARVISYIRVLRYYLTGSTPERTDMKQAEIYIRRLSDILERIDSLTF